MAEFEHNIFRYKVLWETKAACPVELETIPLRDDLSFIDPIRNVFAFI